MPSSYSANLLLELMADGENEGVWGDITNENLETLGRAISGVTTVSLSGTSHTLSVTQGTLSEGHFMVLELGGSPTGTNTITINPNTVARLYIVRNQSGQSAVFTQGSGGNVTVANGDTSIIYCNGGGTGAEVVDVTADFSAYLKTSNNLSDLTNVSTARTNLGLGTAATEDSAAFATSAEGDLATTALQPGDAVPQTSNTGSAELPAGTTAQRDGTPSAGYLRFNTTDGAFEGYNGTEWAGIGGGGIAYTTQTANYTATEGEGVIADTSGGSFTVTLPSSPAEGDVVVIADGDDWSTNNLTVARNGSTIEGAAEDLTLDVGAVSVSFIYDGTTWQIYTQAGSYTATSSIEGFYPTTVSGASQSLDLGSFNFFDAGSLSADATISFTNVPTEAKWQYTFIGDTLSGYDIENASYDSVSFSVASQDSIPTGLFFKDDGTKMYVVGRDSDSVYQYSLSTAWDLSSASYDSVSFSVASQEIAPLALFFKDDGTKMYVVGFVNDTVFQYSLSTAWDVSSASYDSVSFSVASQDTTPAGLFFKPDGTKMYVVGGNNDTVYQYSLSTAWDLSTASYDSVSFSVASQDGAPQGLFFKPDGTKMYVVGSDNDSVYQYSTDDGGIALTFPASVQNPPTENSSAGDKVTYEFYTLDGGTTVYLTSEEIE